MSPSAPSQSGPSDTLTRTAPVQEVFSSVQGEGIYVGKRQVFVRFAHCHLKCAYCDTPMTSPTGQCHVETPPGSGAITLVENPLRPERLVEIISSLLGSARHHSVSFTGGEPLLYHAFLSEALPLLRELPPGARSYHRPPARIYLETSGTQPEFLEPILEYVDILAMDIKLPSTTQEPPMYEGHARFYELAKSAPQLETFIKLIFSDDTTAEELEAVKTIVTDISTPIILQPVTDLKDKNVYLKPQRLFEIEQTLAAHFEDVRVIPQTHKMLKVL